MFSTSYKSPKFNFAFALNNANALPALDAAFGVKNFNGKMSISGSLSGSGLSLTTFQKNIAGNLNFITRSSSWSGFDIDKVTRIAEIDWNLNKRKKDLIESLRSGKSYFNSVKGSATLQNGILNITPIEIFGERFSGAAAMRYMLGSGNSSIAVKFAFLPIGYSKSVEFSLQGKGALSNMNIKFDIAELMNFFIKTAR